MPPSPPLSARITRVTYLMQTMSRMDQMTSEMMPMTLPRLGTTVW